MADGVTIFDETEFNFWRHLLFACILVTVNETPVHLPVF